MSALISKVFAARTPEAAHLRSAQRPTIACRASLADRAIYKAELLTAITPLDRGLTADDDDAAEIDRLCSVLEAVNPNPESLSAPEINGKWRLIYTTSQSILGSSKPAFARPSGPIYQTIDAENLKARNNESAPLYNSVTAALEPMSASKVFVRFVQFKIGNTIPIKAPASATGELDTTYVDADLRISRGDKGNLFVLLQEDPTARL